MHRITLPATPTNTPTSPSPGTDWRSTSRVIAEQERLAQWWAGLIAASPEWCQDERIADRFLGRDGITGDLMVWRIAPGSAGHCRFIERVRDIARAGHLRVVRSVPAAPAGADAAIRTDHSRTTPGAPGGLRCSP